MKVVISPDSCCRTEHASGPWKTVHYSGSRDISAGNLRKLGKNMDTVLKLTEGKNEKEFVEIMLYKLNSLYGDEEMIRDTLYFQEPNAATSLGMIW